MKFQNDSFYKMVKIPYVFCIISLLVFLQACMPPSVPKGPSPQEVAVKFLDTFKKGDMDALMQFYSEEFFKTRPKTQWQEKLAAILKDHGPVERVMFRTKQADTRFRGKFYIFRYDTLHGKKRVSHILTFVRPVTATDTVNLVGHKIDVRNR